jgi:hypothetical protein
MSKIKRRKGSETAKTLNFNLEGNIHEKCQGVVGINGICYSPKRRWC